MGSQRSPTYAIEPVTKEGKNLPGKGKCNHADYIDEMGSGTMIIFTWEGLFTCN